MNDDEPALVPWRIAQEQEQAAAREKRRYAALTEPATRARATEVDPAWRLRAACLHGDPADFYAPDGSADQRRALNICATCPVKTECCEYAEALEDPHGVWGGQRPQDRKGAKRGARLLQQRSLRDRHGAAT